MYKIILLSAFEEDTIQSKIKDLLELQYSSFSPRYFLYSEAAYESFYFELCALSLFSSIPIYILEKIPVSSLEKILSSLLNLSFSSPLILTTGYIKVADPIRKYLASQPGISFLSLKKPSDSFLSSKIRQVASLHGHKIDDGLLTYLLFLYKDSTSSLDADLSLFFSATPSSKFILTLSDFLRFRSTSFFESSYILEQILKKNFSFPLPLETLPSSEIIPFLRLLNFSFISLLSPIKNSFSQLSPAWSMRDISNVLDLLRSLEIQAKKNLFPSLNAFLSIFETTLQKQL